MPVGPGGPCNPLGPGFPGAPGGPGAPVLPCSFVIHINKFYNNSDSVKVCNNNVVSFLFHAVFPNINVFVDATFSNVAVAVAAVVNVDKINNIKKSL